MDHNRFESLKWRNIGPHRAGRVVAVAGDPNDRATFYFGACAGGVWKTEDAGSHWYNISDGYFNTAAIGALEVSVSDPNVIYAGTGEASIRSNVSHGDGVYKSTDAGKTWSHMGLEDTRHIGKIAIHPHDPDTVFVAALGHAWGPNEERGLYRTTDGGETWEKVLYKSDRTGFVDVSIDWSNPRHIYAVAWQTQRYPWALDSGGDESGIWRSTDGGDSWEEITHNKGLPDDEVLGKIGVAASPAQPGRVWALIEAEKGAMYRSDDGGNSWIRLSEEAGLRARPWYYMHVYADPSDAETVWVLNLQCWKSTDGGKTFEDVPTPHGDNHGLWIDPNDSERVIEGNDGGACVSYNAGKSWSTILNQPTAQFYHVTVDNQVPYNVYGSQQDNWAMRLPSVSYEGAISWKDYVEPGGGESGHIAVKPTAPFTVFGGGIGTGIGHGRLRAWNPETRQSRNVTVWPEVFGFGEGPIAHRYRFQWTFPIEISPFDPDKLYVCSNHVHVSTDEGESWETISPDLTRNDPDKQQSSGGPITPDNSGAEIYCTIFAFKESPHEEGVLYAGSDDGLIHISKDGGMNWENITPSEDLLGDWARISIIEVSPHDPAKVYVAANRYQLDDNAPYLFKSEDYGQTWQLINDGIREGDFTRTIREDPNKAGLLYAGTETGIYVSFDDGENWTWLETNLPVCPIHDLVVKDNDLVVATHGRSFWILDDITPLHQMADGIDGDVYLYQPRDSVRFRQNFSFVMSQKPNYVGYKMTGPVTVSVYPVENEYGQTELKYLNAGENPPEGAIIHFYLAEEPGDDVEVKLAFKDSDGNVLRTFSSKGKDSDKLPVRAGANRFVWDMKTEGPTPRKGDDMTSFMLRFMMSATSPKVVPGDYQVTLAIGDEVEQTQTFAILPDPRLDVTQEELEDQFDLKLSIRDSLSEAHGALNQLALIREQVEDWSGRADNEEITEAAKELTDKIKTAEEKLMSPDRETNPMGGPNGLREKLGALAFMIDESDHRPTVQSREVYANLSEDLTTTQYEVRGIAEDDVAAFTRRLQEAGVPMISTTVLDEKDTVPAGD